MVGQFTARPYVPGASAAVAAPEQLPVDVYAAAQLDGGSGVLQAVIGTPRVGGWYVTRLVVNASASSRAYVYIGRAGELSALVDGTQAGQLDIAEYSAPGLFVPEGQALTVRWTIGTGTAGVRASYVPVG